MTLPPLLMQAISDSGGGKVTLVVGAGCSFEAPTSIPLASHCSIESHDRLVADGILSAGDCSNKSDLSCLADAVHAKTGRQAALVSQLRRNYEFKTATPNDGHRIAAALLSEGVISSILTLNFDLAFSNAISELGIGDIVGIVEGPEDLAEQKNQNVYYLHRNVNASDPESWVLRTISLNEAWRNHWESIVAGKVLPTPVVVFAGLGSPAAILTESTKLIQQKIPGASTQFQVDPSDQASSAFFASLGIPASQYIQLGWCAFMEKMAERLSTEQVNRLRSTINLYCLRENLRSEDVSLLLDRLSRMGLVNIGRLRSRWLLHNKPYHPDDTGAREVIADLLHVIAMIERETGATATMFEDGIVEFHRSERVVSVYAIASGRGTRSAASIEAELNKSRSQLNRRANRPLGALISGTRDTTSGFSPPSDVVRGETSGNILFEPSNFGILHVQSLRENRAKCKEVAP